MNTSWLRPSVAVLAVAALAVVSCSSGDDGGSDGAPAEGYSATIQRTANGVPHVTAADFGSLGFGQGFAFAQDHACTLLDQIVKVRGERARWFGPGDDDEYLNSDIA